jgi:hypothetical protein
LPLSALGLAGRLGSRLKHNDFDGLSKVSELSMRASSAAVMLSVMEGRRVIGPVR